MVIMLWRNKWFLSGTAGWRKSENIDTMTREVGSQKQRTGANVYLEVLYKDMLGSKELKSGLTSVFSTMTMLFHMMQ